jgi:hypothetical protein
LSGIKNEEKLTGKGVHYCVSCDGPMYKDKKLVIIGNGNHAAESAIEALSYSKDITIISNADKFNFSDAYDKDIAKWKIKTTLAKVKEFKGEVIHFTMYGLNLNKEIGKIRKSKKDKMIVIGSQKVPSEMYQLADYNISIGSQPHSEVAALAVFLDRLFEGSELSREFEQAKIRILPSQRGKQVARTVTD